MYWSVLAGNTGQCFHAVLGLFYVSVQRRERTITQAAIRWQEDRAGGQGRRTGQADCGIAGKRAGQAYPCRTGSDSVTTPG